MGRDGAKAGVLGRHFEACVWNLGAIFQPACCIVNSGIYPFIGTSGEGECFQRLAEALGHLALQSFGNTWQSGLGRHSVKETSLITELDQKLAASRRYC